MIARILSETDTTVTVEWDRIPGVGYRFLRDGAHLSHTWDSTRTRTTFAKTASSHVFEVQALIPDVARVQWPTPKPPPTDAILINSAARLRDALANGKTGQTFKVTGNYTGQLEVTTDEAPVFDFAGSIVDGGTQYAPFHVHDCGAVRLLNINATGGASAGVLINGNAKGVKVTGLIHDSQGTGLLVQGNAGPNTNLSVDVEITNCGLSWRTKDPHGIAGGQPGTGWHASYLGGSLQPSSGAFKIRAHDQPSGSACQVGANLRDSTIDIDARRITRNVSEAPFGRNGSKQVAGNALQLWGAGNRNVQVVRLYAEDCVGGAVETDGLDTGSIAIGANRSAVRCGPNPWKTHPSVKYL